MTTGLDESAGSGRIPRVSELVLARAHLRLGLLALARTELEAAAATGSLDPQGMVDLAEVRWRTGDLRAAGQAADAALESGMQDPVAYVVASEAAADKGRPSEARRLASQAMVVAPTTIDIVFAGMPRSNVWAPDANEPLPLAPTLFDRGLETDAALPPPNDTAAPAVAEASADPSSAPMTLGLWPSDEGVAAVAALPDPAEAFDAGRSALVQGAFDEAAFHLGLALRLAPALAPAVLEITDGARARSLILARGDAYRLAGHETEARQAYAIAAAGGLPERRARVRVKSMISAAEATEILRRLPPDAESAPEVAAPDAEFAPEVAAPDAEFAPEVAAPSAGSHFRPGDTDGTEIDARPPDLAVQGGEAEAASAARPTETWPDAEPETTPAALPDDTRLPGGLAGPDDSGPDPEDDHQATGASLMDDGSAAVRPHTADPPAIEAPLVDEPAPPPGAPIIVPHEVAFDAESSDAVDEAVWRAESEPWPGTEPADPAASEGPDDPGSGPGGSDGTPDAPLHDTSTDIHPPDPGPGT
jgi:tetratricopeptide (TPR) repeat protein